ASSASAAEPPRRCWIRCRNSSESKRSVARSSASRSSPIPSGSWAARRSASPPRSRVERTPSTAAAAAVAWSSERNRPRSRIPVIIWSYCIVTPCPHADDRSASLTVFPCCRTVVALLVIGGTDTSRIGQQSGVLHRLRCGMRRPLGFLLRSRLSGLPPVTARGRTARRRTAVTKSFHPDPSLVRSGNDVPSGSGTDPPTVHRLRRLRSVRNPRDRPDDRAVLDGCSALVRWGAARHYPSRLPYAPSAEL